MEISLMYEVLYTKATVAHTWPGYLIRFLSPVCSAAAAALFWLHLHRDRGGKVGRHMVGASASSFVVITYLLLGTAFALDVVWLLRALGSTWTYAFLKKKLAPPPPRRPWPCAWSAWLHHQALCADGWWRRLHRFVVYLDPLRLFGITDDPVAYRRWSGTIGRYNLLRECTVPRLPWSRCLRSLALATKLGLQDKKYLSELPPEVKQLVFERVQWILPTAGNSNPDPYTMVNITTEWGHEAIRRGAEAKLFREPDDEPILGREFEQDVLVWHMGTSLFLSRSMVRKKILKSSTAAGHVRAIEAMSEYLMFLVAERRQMLPGLVLHSQLEDTRTTLEDIWHGPNKGNPTTTSAGHEDDKDKLARLVQQMRKPDRRSWLETEESRRLVLDAAEVDGALTSGSTRQKKEVFLVPMLDLIFNVWVDKLVYAAVRCSREAHAEQLSAGGDLTTVLWMLIQHAGPFCNGEAENIYFVRPAPQEKEEEKKKKKEEERKKKKKPPPPPLASPLPPPPCCPVCPPYYHPSYPPVCPPYYDPSWPPVCPWYPECPPQHERPADEPEEAIEDEHEDSSSDEDSEE